MVESPPGLCNADEPHMKPAVAPLALVEDAGPEPAPLPSDVDDRARAEGATVAIVRDLIPKECFVIEPARSWSALAVGLLRLALSMLILSRIQPAWGPGLAWQIPALLAAWLFAGWCYT